MTAKQSKYRLEKLTSVRVSRDVAKLVRDNKLKTGMSVSKFFSTAAMEKLKSQTKSK